MDQNSLPHKEKLLIQLKEAYGKVVYTYTAHNKEIEIIRCKNILIKYTQIVLSAVSTGGIIGSIFSENELKYKVLASIMSTSLLAINLFFKDFDLKEEIDSHQIAADELWVIREQYISLLTDFSILSDKEIMEKRDELQLKTSEVYKNSPHTTKKGYNLAQNALKQEEEQFFSNEELDKILPKHLRNNKDIH
ncbi:SLATT domain-containing protein [Enterococcus hirae]